MNTEFRIKNFRVFDEEGVTLDIKPITILTGCNSSGKSSIVKAISLLSQFVQNIIHYCPLKIFSISKSDNL